MTFAPVKSNPWERKRKRRRPRFRLWSDQEWRRILDTAAVGGDWRKFVRELNERLYGNRNDEM